MSADKCESCGRWMIKGQSHSCSPDLGEVCNAVDIANCVVHGYGKPH